MPPVRRIVCKYLPIIFSTPNAPTKKIETYACVYNKTEHGVANGNSEL